MHAEHEHYHHDGAENNAAMHRFAVFIRDAAHGGVRQADNAEADQHRKGAEERRVDNVADSFRRHQLRIDSAQFGYRRIKPARLMNHGEQQQKGAHQHHQALHSVVEHAGAKAAEGGVERDSAAENQQAGIVRNTCSGLQQSRAADKLHRHRADKGHQQADARQPDQQRAAIAGIKHIVQRHRIIAARQNSEFLPQHAERQPDRRHLNHRQQYPAKTIFIGRAGSANKRTGTDIGGGDGHRQYKPAHGAAAEKIFSEKTALTLFAHGKHRQPGDQRQVSQQRKNDFTFHRYPLTAYRETPDVPSTSTAR